MLLSIIVSLIMLLYCSTIVVLIYGFTKVNTLDFIGLKPKTKFSIIIPFRNEAKNLPTLLESLSRLNYPMDLVEVLLVDDASQEEFQILSFEFQVSVIKNVRISNSPKKDAIVTAIQTVKTDWVITTDADCVVPKNWLLVLDNYIQLHNVAMIAGPVTYDCNDFFIHQFQQADIASLQGATIGSFGINKGFMCNGANFAYTKKFFQELHGFEGNNNIASGDDVFLLQKAIRKAPKKVHYLKTQYNIINTKPHNDWRLLFFQRVRWASKTSSYQNTFGTSLATVVFLGNINIVLMLIFFILSWVSITLLCTVLLLKMIIDSILIYKTNRFLSQKKISYLALSSMLYPFFSTSVALYSLLGSYEWKGRHFTK